MSEYKPGALTKELSQWYHSQVKDVFLELQTGESGLSSPEATQRLEQYGLNALDAEKKDPAWLLLIRQFTSLLIIILFAAAVIAAFMGDVVEAIAIIVIVVLAGVTGFIQEYQAGKAIESLKKMAAPQAHVIRDGVEKVVNSEDLVPGDLVVLKTGDKIPADARLVEAQNLRVEEASLTGESLAVEKHTHEILDLDVSLGDRKNMVYMGTSISYGRGKAIVTDTGMKTEFGKIASLLQNTENRKTPLQQNLDELGKKIGIFSIILAAAMSVLGVFQGHTLVEMFVWGVAVAVAVIPEALPAVVTISLALGVRRMVKRKSLIRKLPAVETLGAINIICSDKTGTLTQDEMTIRKIYSGGEVFDVTGVGYNPVGEFQINGIQADIGGKADLLSLLTFGSLCSDTKIVKDEDGWDVLGDPTEGGIVVAAEKAGIKVEEIRKKHERIHEIPFSSETKRMTTVHLVNGKRMVSSKGAVEVILDSCSFYADGGKSSPLTPEIRAKILDIAFGFGENALRVLGISYKEMPNVTDDYSGGESSETFKDIEKNMTFAGLVGMIDPPRMEVKDSIKTCFSAGIKPIMITGDHKITAVAVAKELGILRGGRAISGNELEKMSDKEFELTVDNTEVYARISPAHKLKIVESLMKRGNIVAMTGDGVNDAPSLKKADIGVAMGITGTDVSKEAADMILTDDNFASIVNAVEEGRSIFENIRKYLVYLLSGNMGTVFAMIITLLATLPLPLHAVQILFINFIMDGLIAIALGVEPPEPGIMTKRPRKVNEGILSRKALWFIGAVGLWISLVTTAVFVWGLYDMSLYPEGTKTKTIETTAVTMFFMTLIFARLFNGYNTRSLYQSSFKMKVFSNKSLFVASGIALMMSLSSIGFEIFHPIFKVTYLTGFEWLIIIGAGASTLVFGEIWKLLTKNKFN
ncbi:MAG: cation-translocating P-type ATPase [Ignavibacteriaceae bacterium]|nr:cation-translocating P-type ATPase [Ignavibacteriaceae bacterium]